MDSMGWSGEIFSRPLDVPLNQSDDVNCLVKCGIKCFNKNVCGVYMYI